MYPTVIIKGKTYHKVNDILRGHSTPPNVGTVVLLYYGSLNEQEYHDTLTVAATAVLWYCRSYICESIMILLTYRHSSTIILRQPDIKSIRILSVLWLPQYYCPVVAAYARVPGYSPHCGHRGTIVLW
jgi:hypothetical protein